MIKHIETLIKLIISVAAMWFLYHLVLDVTKFTKKTNDYDSEIDKITKENRNLEIAIQKSKDFYEENQKIIESTKISNEDLKLISEAIFQNITDKKLGFFTLQNIQSERNPKIINVYSLKGILKLEVDALFSLEEAKNMINNEVNKSIIKINELNKDKFEIIPTFISINGSEYFYEFNIFKKHNSI